MHTDTTAADLRTDAIERLTAGRLVLTGKSRVTGEHITLRFFCKNKGLKPRGSVKLEQAIILAVDAGRVQQRTKVGRHGETHEYIAGDKVCWTGASKFLTRATVNIRKNIGADDARYWFATMVIDWLRCGLEVPGCDINLEDFCTSCGRQLTDPISKQRTKGPVCFGKETGSQHQQRGTRKVGEQMTLPTEDPSERRSDRRRQLASQ